MSYDTKTNPLYGADTPCPSCGALLGVIPPRLCNYHMDAHMVRSHVEKLASYAAELERRRGEV